MKIKKIEWSGEQPANNHCSYNHVIGKSPIGDFLITWKGWKESPSFTIDESPFGWINCLSDTLDDAKAEAQKVFAEKILSCLENV